MNDYGFPERRKNKNDKRAKRRYSMFKKGGQHRSDNVQISNSDKNN